MSNRTWFWIVGVIATSCLFAIAGFLLVFIGIGNTASALLIWAGMGGTFAGAIAALVASAVNFARLAQRDHEQSHQPVRNDPMSNRCWSRIVTVFAASFVCAFAGFFLAFLGIGNAASTLLVWTGIGGSLAAAAAGLIAIAIALLGLARQACGK